MSEAEKSSRADAAGPSDALAHWHAQEQAALPPPPRAPETAPQPAGWQMPSGWWIIPATTAGVPIWVALLRLIF